MFAGELLWPYFIYLVSIIVFSYFRLEYIRIRCRSKMKERMNSTWRSTSYQKWTLFASSCFKHFSLICIRERLFRWRIDSGINWNSRFTWSLWTIPEIFIEFDSIFSFRDVLETRFFTSITCTNWRIDSCKNNNFKRVHFVIISYDRKWKSAITSKLVITLFLFFYSFSSYGWFPVFQCFNSERITRKQEVLEKHYNIRKMGYITDLLLLFQSPKMFEIPFLWKHSFTHYATTANKTINFTNSCKFRKRRSIWLLRFMNVNNSNVGYVSINNNLNYMMNSLTTFTFQTSNS